VEKRGREDGSKQGEVLRTVYDFFAAMRKRGRSDGLTAIQCSFDGGGRWQAGGK
jgi:hypothetical protein